MGRFEGKALLLTRGAGRVSLKTAIGRQLLDQKSVPGSFQLI
jgi:hypothetical protein